MVEQKLRHLNFAVTYHCNSRCLHCDIWKMRPAGELTLAEIDAKVVQSPLLDDIESVGITGGEPFIRKDLTEICRLFYERRPGIHIGIASHGMRGLKIAERAIAIHDLAPEGQFSLSISIDGEEADHDQQRGIIGAYQQTMDTVRILRTEGVKLCLSFTVTPQNYRSIRPVYELARTMGVGYLMRFAQISAFYDNQGTDFSWTEESLKEASTAIDGVLTEILACYDLSQPQLDPYIYFLSRAVEYQQTQSRLTPCFSGTHSLLLDSFGRVFPCVMLDQECGSIREHSLIQIYHASELEAARVSIARNECHCWTECETIRSLEVTPGQLDWNPEEVLPQYSLGVKKVNGALHGVRREAEIQEQ